MAYHGKLLKDMTAAQRQKRIASLDPGARHKVDIKYLTGPLLQQRLLQQRLNAPVVPGSSLTNRDLAQEAQAAVQVQYGPQETSLAQQVASNQQQPRVTGGYYDQWLAQIRAAAAQQQQAQTALSTQLATLGQGVAGAATGQNTANLSALQADAATRGATVDPSLATTAAQGTAVNQGVANAQAGTAALQGQAQQGFMAALAGAAQAGRVQALNQIASQGQALAGQQTALRGQEGAANITYRSKRRSEEGQNVLNTALANSQIDARTTASQVAQQNADAHTTSAKAAAKRAAQAGKPSTVARPPSTYPGSAADWNGMSLSERQAWMKQHPTGRGTTNTKDQYGNTPKDVQRNTSTFAKALRIAKLIGGTDPGAILTGLTLKLPNADDTILVGAAQMAALDHVGPKTAGALRKLGVAKGYKTRKARKAGGVSVAPGPGTGNRPT